jgi:hypothetical protein
MNIPRFSAEASLYKTSTHDCVASEWASATDIHVVYPARTCTKCFCDIYDFGEPGSCAKLCQDTLRGFEYPVDCLPSECNPSCDKPICGPCTQTCQYLSGSIFTQPC